MLRFLKAEPAAAYVASLGAIVALIVAFWHLDGTKAGYLSAIATALGSILTAVLAKPRHLAVIGGAVGVILQALLLFNVHMSSGMIAAVVAAVNLALGYLVMRPQLTPTAHAATRM